MIQIIGGQILMRFGLILFCVISLWGCRGRLGAPCTSKDGCALGLYCDLEREVCEDRGKLLKKKAEEIYVYPIPAKQPTKAVPTPIPR